MFSEIVILISGLNKLQDPLQKVANVNVRHNDMRIILEAKCTVKIELYTVQHILHKNDATKFTLTYITLNIIECNSTA